MSGLVSKGLIQETIDRPKQYRPVDVKHAIPRLAVKTRDRLDIIVKESRHMVAKLEGLTTNVKRTPLEEVRVIYGPYHARAHLLESVESANVEFWGIAGRRRPPHISNRLFAEGLRLLKSKGIKTRFILEIDKENLKRVKKMTGVAEVAHYRPIPLYMYGVDDKSVALSLAQEPISRPSHTVQLVATYRPVVQVMRQFFNILWRESTPFALREAILLGRRPLDSNSRITRGREEAYTQTQVMMDSAKNSIRIYNATRFGPVRLLKGLGEALSRAHTRGAKVRAICRLSDGNIGAVKTLAKSMEVRHTDNPIGFNISVVDEFDAALYYVDPDSEELESRADYTIRITSKQGIRHIGNLFEALWEESIPIEGLLQKYEKSLGESSNPPG